MKYINGNILCLEGCEFIRTDKNPDGLVPEGTYKSLYSRGKIVTHGRGGNGNGVLIEYESLPPMYKELVKSKFGDVYEHMAKQPIRDLIKPDLDAIKFFQTYILPDGKKLDGEKRMLYANDAAILNAFKYLLSNKRELKRTLNISLTEFWNAAGELIKDISTQYPNTLPTSRRRLEPLYKEYMREEYVALIDKRLFNESNNKKVDDNVEHLILSLYVQNNKPYVKEVYELYERFMNGEIEILKDANTGELFNPLEFYKDGAPLMLSETTVWRYINKPINRAVVDKMRTSALEFSSKYRPHQHRHAPNYSLSKITMDDISLPFKMQDGKRVWSYQIMDVASGCIIGKSYGKSNDEGSGKNRGLFMQAILDMFRNVVNNNWGMPAQIEVEQHISNTFAEDLLREGYVFPFVRFCRGGNPQEKRAEHIINRKKYGLQKKREGFQARPFARTEANRLNEDKNNVRYTFDEICANENADIETWNNSLHPNQDKFPGLTRWQVLCNNLNPQLIEPDLSLISKYIGLQTVTTIQRSQYVIVKHNKYVLPSVQVLEQLNTLQVTAYYIPSQDGAINEVHLYQDDCYVCTCGLLEKYNEAFAERTEEDEKIMQTQFGYRSSFDSEVKKRVTSLAKVQVFQNNTAQIAPKQVVKQPENTVEIIVPTPVKTDWKRKALEDL